ncbi:MAG TPA: hypothetical protein VHV55_16620 [Pirellulales bacterium]|jgi:hypothetical protein|nr:hypothetical protein [Pirellulales bacterium]
MRSALSVLIVLLALVPLRADDAPVLFSDHFATLDPSWGDANQNVSAGGNKLVIQPDVNSGFSKIRQGSVFKDADIRVSVVEAKGTTGQTAGIVFWAGDTDNYYLAQINLDGFVGITRLQQDRQLTLLHFAPSDAVVKGVGQANALRVVTVGKLATVYVNGKQIGAIKGFPPEGGSRIGLHAESNDAVNTWQFSDLEVRQPAADLAPTAASASATTDPSVILSDDFSMLDPAWGPPDNEQSIAGGKLVLKPGAGSSYSSLYQGNWFGDADIRVKLAETGGGTDAPAGIMFWGTDYKNYYMAQVQPDGTVGITRLVQGQQLNPLSYARSDAVVKDAGQVNALRVVTQGKLATFYVNDKQIALIKGFPPAGGGKIGLHAESGNTPYTWQFSDLEVRQPAATSSAVAADPAVIFSDDFSTLDPAWGPPDGQQSVASGNLVFQPGVGTSYTSLYQGALFGDADIRVKINEASGGPDQPAGVVFWGIDYANLYVAQLRGDGSVGVSQLTKGDWRAPIPYTVRAGLVNGVGQANELRIVTRGKQATVYINGQQIAAIDGVPPAGGGKIGLRAVSGNQDIYTWQFSGLTVRKP